MPTCCDAGAPAVERQPWPFRLSTESAFHFLAAWPGFLYCPLHLRLRLAGLLRLVTQFVILFPGNPSSILLPAARCLLGHHVLLCRVTPVVAWKRASRNSGTSPRLSTRTLRRCLSEGGTAGGPGSRTCSRGLSFPELKSRLAACHGVSRGCLSGLKRDAGGSSGRATARAFPSQKECDDIPHVRPMPHEGRTEISRGQLRSPSPQETHHCG
jgi:hypothetical protein